MWCLVDLSDMMDPKSLVYSIAVELCANDIIFTACLFGLLLSIMVRGPLTPGHDMLCFDSLTTLRMPLFFTVPRSML